jgi:hypothetical protein
MDIMVQVRIHLVPTYILIISSIYISVTMQHKIVTVTLIFIHGMFRPYTAINKCPRYSKLFIALLVSILKLKLKFQLK